MRPSSVRLVTPGGAEPGTVAEGIAQRATATLEALAERVPCARGDGRIRSATLVYGARLHGAGEPAGRV
ncbi:hypothetical protein WMF31_36765 [Sorangium sp. So ce1036]|uniref:hypothetical protein n=1 Tax=Sorangium sp. So ce1036 TaxID=3133328 RepID=UPI003EFD729E